MSRAFIWERKDDSAQLWNIGVILEMVMAYTKDSFEDAMYKEPNTGCWLHPGKSPYGPIKIAYKLFKGGLPKGDRRDAQIMHECDTPACVNPKHLSIGTRSQNMKQMMARNRMRNNAIALKRAITHCKRGHLYTEQNNIPNKRGSRDCRICKYMRQNLRRSGPNPTGTKENEK